MTSAPARFRPSITYGRRLLALLLVLLTVGCTAPAREPSVPAVLIPSTPVSVPTAPATALPTPAPVVLVPSTPAAVPTAPPTALPAPPSTPRPPDSIAVTFSGQRALADLRWLTETFGSRPTGSEAERQAAEA